MMPAPTVTGFILAGGRSSRMGRDKALLSLEVHSFIERIASNLRPHVTSLFIIGHSRYRHMLSSLSIDGILTDLAADRGPLMGIYTGLMHSSSMLNLFASCDMPLVNERTITRLLHAWSNTCDIATNQLPDGRLHPFPLVCHLRNGRIAGRLLNQGERSLQGWIHRSRSRLCLIEDTSTAHALTNVNTPEDYLQLCRDTERTLL